MVPLLTGGVMEMVESVLGGAGPPAAPWKPLAAQQQSKEKGSYT